MVHRLLIVDDDILHLESSQEFLENRGYVVDTSSTGEGAIEKVRANPYLYSLVVLDYRLEDKDGAAIAEAMTAINPDLFILMFSGDSSREAVLLSTRRGACGFVDKSEGAVVFLAEVAKWCKKFEQTTMTISTCQPLTDREILIQSIGMVGRSERLANIASTMQKVRSRSGSVLILGESGTGKELLARSLHRSDQGFFQAINCGAFRTNPQLMASTLFGHVKGAFTGAQNDKKGVFEEVQGGTVLLDEVDALPIPSQVELLRVLQERAVIPVGGTRETPVKFRLVAAAKPQLMESINEETFKPDLFYRISRIIVTVPPLRERPEDIEPLVRHFCKQWSEENGEQKTFLLSTIPYLQNYSWPGNVRELENVVFSLLDISTEDKISPKQLDAKFFEKQVAAPILSGQLLPLKERLERAERQHLITVLSLSRSLREAGRQMGVSASTVVRMLRKHGLKAQNFLTVEKNKGPQNGTLA